METTGVTRRAILGLMLAPLVTRPRWPPATEAYAAEELKVPDNAQTETFDFGTRGIEG